MTNPIAEPADLGTPASGVANGLLASEGPSQSVGLGTEAAGSVADVFVPPAPKADGHLNRTITDRLSPALRSAIGRLLRQPGSPLRKSIRQPLQSMGGKMARLEASASTSARGITAGRSSPSGSMLCSVTAVRRYPGGG